MKLDWLAEHPELVPTLAIWQHEEWGYLNPAGTVADRIERLSRHGRGGIPSTVVALSDAGEPLGSAAIIAQDMHTHTELTPWLASVYVDRPHRGRGIGSQLVERIQDEARRLGVERLYLFTPDQEALYARLGWRVRSREPYLGEDIVLMELDL